jgi:phenolic acid decarboxylase
MKIILVVSAIISSVIMSSCNQKTDLKIEPNDLIGKTIEYTYGESIYHVTIDSDTQLHWEAMAGDEKGVLEEETYVIESIGDATLFITWGEANGIGVSQVLDFKNGVVHNHLIKGRIASLGLGKIRMLE